MVTTRDFLWLNLQERFNLSWSSAYEASLLHRETHLLPRAPLAKGLSQGIEAQCGGRGRGGCLLQEPERQPQMVVVTLWATWQSLSDEQMAKPGWGWGLPTHTKTKQKRTALKKGAGLVWPFCALGKNKTRKHLVCPIFTLFPLSSGWLLSRSGHRCSSREGRFGARSLVTLRPCIQQECNRVLMAVGACLMMLRFWAPKAIHSLSPPVSQYGQVTHKQVQAGEVSDVLIQKPHQIYSYVTLPNSPKNLSNRIKKMQYMPPKESPSSKQFVSIKVISLQIFIFLKFIFLLPFFFFLTPLFAKVPSFTSYGAFSPSSTLWKVVSEKLHPQIWSSRGSEKGFWTREYLNGDLNKEKEPCSG